MSDKRMEDLEVKIAFLEHQVHQLDELVRELGDAVLPLTKEVRQLKERLRELGDDAPTNPHEHEKPPHYGS